MRDPKDFQDAIQEGRSGHYSDIQFTGEAFEKHLQAYQQWERSGWTAPLGQ